jgi:hypothetical protein
MLKIESGKPWIMWPDIMANNFIDNPANKVFDSEGDFKFRIIFELEEPVKENDHCMDAMRYALYSERNITCQIS